MKKQVLTLTMCLALTATTALAAGTQVVSKAQVKEPAKVQVQPSAQNALKSTEQTQITTREDIKRKFDEKRNKERELMYTALSLTAEQKAKAEALDEQAKAEAGKLLRKVRTEAKKLRDLKTKHASIFAIYKQKFILRSAKIDAKNYLEKSRRDFEAILTPEQKVKFKAIKEARREEFQKFKKEHKHGIHKGYYSHEMIGPKPEKVVPPADKK